MRKSDSLLAIRTFFFSKRIDHKKYSKYDEKLNKYCQQCLRSGVCIENEERDRENSEREKEREWAVLTD